MTSEARADGGVGCACSQGRSKEVKTREEQRVITLCMVHRVCGAQGLCSNKSPELSQGSAVLSYSTSGSGY